MTGGNLLRVLKDVERVKESLKDRLPSSAVYEKRKDLPATRWGGPGGAYLPPGVKSLVAQRKLRDEL